MQINYKKLSYFKMCRKKDETVMDFLFRQEKARAEWKKLKGKEEELEGMILIHQAGINDTDYHVVMGACGEDKGYENVWNTIKRIYGGREEKGEQKLSWYGEREDEGQSKKGGMKLNPMNKYGRRSRCINCRGEDHWLKDCNKAKECWICHSREHYGKD